MLIRGQQSICGPLWHTVLPTFLKNLLESEIWSVVLRPGRKQHWVSFSIGISRHLFQGTWQRKR